MRARICTECGKTHKNRATRCRSCVIGSRARQINATRQALIDQGIAEERARIVADLRNGDQWRWSAPRSCADYIERGEHVGAAKAEGDKS